MEPASAERLDILTRSVDALLRWAESHPLTQWADMGTLSALREELEETVPDMARDGARIADDGLGRASTGRD
ncbi:MAG TPA: hypothetical protein VFI42_20245 [Thermomicrobiaceae bacterium]|nr:hypothetical protein [Thermomicrobiaceae bacterium]